MVRNLIGIVVGVFLLGIIAGCGGGSSSTTGGAQCVSPGSTGQGTIVFESNSALDCSNNTGSNAIWIAGNTGGAKPLLPSSMGIDLLQEPSFPTWSPDGQRIAYVEENPGGTLQFNIWVVNADGSNPVNLTNLTAGGADDQVWSPDGAKIAYSSARALDGSNNTNPVSNVWVMNADGSGQRPLTTATTGANLGHPAWSPDGSKIAYDGIVLLTGNIFVVNADGTGVTMLMQGTNPHWSPDGAKIAFASNIDPNGSGSTIVTNNLWVIQSDGSAAGPLTKLTINGVLPIDVENPLELQWSPDGTTIAFTWMGALDGSNAANTTFNIFTVKEDGLPAKPLTQFTAANAHSPAWSANGMQIAFSSSQAPSGGDVSTCPANLIGAAEACPSNIWIMNADGSNPVPLTKSTSFFPLVGMGPFIPVSNENPRWHP